MSEQVPAGAAPAPAAGSAVPGELATYGQRIIAFVIDYAIIIVVMIVLGIVGGLLAKITSILTIITSLLSLVISLGYFIYLVGMDNPLTANGQTMGKKLMGIKIIKMDGGAMTPVDALLRLVGYCVSSILSIGFIFIFIDENNQGFHDKIAKTYVVKAD